MSQQRLIRLLVCLMTTCSPVTAAVIQTAFAASVSVVSVVSVVSGLDIVSDAGAARLAPDQFALVMNDQYLIGLSTPDQWTARFVDTPIGNAQLAHASHGSTLHVVVDRPEKMHVPESKQVYVTKLLQHVLALDEQVYAALAHASVTPAQACDAKPVDQHFCVTRTFGSSGRQALPISDAAYDWHNEIYVLSSASVGKSGTARRIRTVYFNAFAVPSDTHVDDYLDATAVGARRQAFPQSDAALAAEHIRIAVGVAGHWRVLAYVRQPNGQVAQKISTL